MLLSLESRKSVAYLEEMFQSERHMSKKLPPLVRLMEGNFYAVLPDDVSIRDVYAFNDGVLTGIQDCRAEQSCRVSAKLDPSSNLSDVLWEFLLAENSFLVMDDYMADLGDEDLEQRFSRSWRCENEEIYHVINSSDDDVRGLLPNLIRALNLGWYFICVGGWKGNNRDVKLSQLCVDDIRIAVVNAYDGEGFVVWALDELTKTGRI